MGVGLPPSDGPSVHLKKWNDATHAQTGVGHVFLSRHFLSEAFPLVLSYQST